MTQRTSLSVAAVTGGTAGGDLEERCVWVDDFESNFRFSVFDPRLALSADRSVTTA